MRAGGWNIMDDGGSWVQVSEGGGRGVGDKAEE